MQVELERLNEDEVRLTIGVEAERVEQALDQAYKNLVRQVRIPGFRPGKAPRPIFENMYGRQALYEQALQDLLPKVYEDAVTELELEPFEDGDIEEVEPQDGGLQVKAHVLLRPDVKLPDYKNYPVDESEPLSDEMIDQAVEQLRRENATMLPADEIGENDVVEVQGVLHRDGQAEEQEFTDQLQMDQVYPEIREALQGAKVGDERDATFETPDGEKVLAKFAVQDIRTPELPEVTDEFATELGYSDLKEMREKLANALRDEAEARAAQQRAQALFERIVSESEARLPELLVGREAHRLQHVQADQAGEDHDHEHDHDHGEPDEATLEQARQNVTRALVREELMRQENIRILPAELRAAASGLEAQRGGQKLSENEVQALYGILMEERLMGHLGKLGAKQTAE